MPARCLPHRPPIHKKRMGDAKRDTRDARASKSRCATVVCGFYAGQPDLLEVRREFLVLENVPHQITRLLQCHVARVPQSVVR